MWASIELEYFKTCFIITGFMDFAIIRNYKLLENSTFRKLDLFPFSLQGRETPILWGPLERGPLERAIFKSLDSP
jgi:hypothetical protein